MERKKINRLKVVLAEKGMTNKQLAEIRYIKVGYECCPAQC